MTNHDANQRPSLSEIEPLRPIEEVEEAAYPGMSPRERRLDQQAQEGDMADGTGTIIPLVPVAAAAPAETNSTSAGMGAAPPVAVAMGAAALSEELDNDDQAQRERTR